LILQLAVRGKLVPQDPSDEPTSVLLKRIKAEKEQLIKEGKIGRSKPLPPYKNDDLLDQLPEGWARVRLADLGEFCGGATPSTGRPDYWGGEIPWVSPKDMKAPHITTSELFITEKVMSGRWWKREEGVIIRGS